MSITNFGFNPQTPECQIRRESFRRLFADIIENARRATGRKIGQAARLAGMELTEWLAVETGYKRPDELELHSMAPVLAMSRTRCSGSSSCVTRRGRTRAGFRTHRQINSPPERGGDRTSLKLRNHWSRE